MNSTTERALPHHHRHIVACLWDFDKTLTPHYMQEPLFKAYQINQAQFWREVNGLSKAYLKHEGVRVSSETAYLNHLLSYVQKGLLKDLSNARLKELGKRIELYAGLPEFFKALKALPKAYSSCDIHLEHYVLSTGLKAMIEGSRIAEQLDGIFACEFIETPMMPHYQEQQTLPFNTTASISQIGTMVDNTTKTRFVFEISKGVNQDPSLHVNDLVPSQLRRVPIANMIYTADGPSDVPTFSVIKRYGGVTLAVYKSEEEAALRQNDRLRKNGRVDMIAPADYRKDKTAAQWLTLQVKNICARIVQEKERDHQEHIGAAPQHIHLDPHEKRQGPYPEAEAGRGRGDLGPHEKRQGLYPEAEAGRGRGDLDPHEKRQGLYPEAEAGRGRGDLDPHEKRQGLYSQKRQGPYSQKRQGPYSQLFGDGETPS